MAFGVLGSGFKDQGLGAHSLEFGFRVGKIMEDLNPPLPLPTGNWYGKKRKDDGNYQLQGSTVWA